MGLLDWLFPWRAREREARRQRELEETQRRLRAPRWADVEARLGRPVPAVLRALYEDVAFVTSYDAVVVDPSANDADEVAWSISAFVPADEEAVTPEEGSFPAGAFNFACNGYGDPYYVRLGELPDGDGRVYVHYHEGDDTELVAPSLGAFLSWPRAER